MTDLLQLHEQNLQMVDHSEDGERLLCFFRETQPGFTLLHFVNGLLHRLDPLLHSLNTTSSKYKLQTSVSRFLSTHRNVSVAQSRQH